jgi:hypothetical protein
VTCPDSIHLEREVSIKSRNMTRSFIKIWGPAGTIRGRRGGV